LENNLRERLQPEVGYWKESDVESKVKDFYINKTRPVEPQPPIPPPNGDDLPGETPKKPPVPSDKLNYVRNKITQANLPTTSYKWILVRVLEKFPETADIINENLEQQ
jgi:hypothetical protein